MGNRAVITASENKSGIGIYLHWNGGISSVVAFLDAAKERGYRDPVSDTTYAMARLTGLIHEFIGIEKSTSLGINTLDKLDCDNWDNGVYVVGENWELVKRWGDGSEPLSPESVFAARQARDYIAITNKLRLSVEA